MALFKSLLGKKKSEDTDGQEEYFREDFAPVVKQPSKKRADPKPEVKEVKPAPKKATAKTVTKEEKPVSKSTSKAKKASTDNAPTAKAVKKSVEVKPKAKSGTKTVKSAPSQNKSTKPSTNKSSVKAKTKPAKTKELSDDSPEVKGAVAIKEGRDTANGKWDIRRAKDGRYFFSLYASNHTVIAYSQVYSSTTAVATGINSVITNAPKCEIEDTTLKKPVLLPCPKWEIYLDKADEYRFRLYAPNGLVVCHAAHGYASKSGCKGGIESIKRFCVEAKVDKSYLK